MKGKSVITMAKSQAGKNLFRGLVLLSFLAVLLSSFYGVAGAQEGHEEINVALIFLELAVILLMAKIGASIVEYFGQPGVLGELLVGILLGNLYLVGLTIFDPLQHDQNIFFLAQLGVVVLLFQIGLESNVSEMLKVGFRAFLVAMIGVVVPFAIGAFFVGPWLLPGLPFTTYLFLGAALTATSVGITARVFQDLGKAHIPEAKIVLGAAVIDDVMGLVVLAVVSAIATVGTISGLSVVWIIAKATLFLLGSIVIGQMVAPKLGEWLSKIHKGIGMKFTLAISFALVFAYLAQKIGLAPIVGAFAAGLVLDPIHFKYFSRPDISRKLTKVIGAENASLSPELVSKITEAAEIHADEHIERLIRPIGYMLVPIFFVLTGMGVRLETLFDQSILLTALAITVAAFIGKIVAGLAAGRVNKWIVGWGMVPRGEVGLIFAVTGKTMGVINDGVYSIIVIVVTLSTLLIPPILAFLLKRQK